MSATPMSDSFKPSERTRFQPRRKRPPIAPTPKPITISMPEGNLPSSNTDDMVEGYLAVKIEDWNALHAKVEELQDRLTAATVQNELLQDMLTILTATLAARDAELAQPKA